MDARVIERTLYPPLVDFLKEIGFDSIGEARIGKGASDVIFTLNGHRFILEIKIEKFSPTLSTNAIGQVLRYARGYNTHDVIVMRYSEEIKNKIIPDGLWLKRIALEKKRRFRKVIQ